MNASTGRLRAVLALIIVGLVAVPAWTGGLHDVPPPAAGESSAVPAADEPIVGPPAPSIHYETPDDAPAPLSVVMQGRRTSPARVWTRGVFESIQVNVDAEGNNIVGDAANEPSIAVDPNNGNRMAIGWRQFDTVLNNFRQAGYGYTEDGGQTWTFPGVLQPGQFRSDPVLGSDADGNFYFYSLSSVTSAELFKSTDGGKTWTGPVNAFGGDKEWMTIDQTARIGRGNIYGIWNVQFSCCPPFDFTRSTSAGLFFMFPIAVPQPSMKWGTLAVGPDGELYSAGATLGQDTHIIAKSTNARNPNQTPLFDFVTYVSLGGTTASGGLPNPGGLLGQVWVATDHSSGPSRGNVYILASVNPPGGDPLDVMFIRSTDGGLTWSHPVRVNDDPAGSGAWQWFGTMSVAPNGRIDVIWNDTRSDAGATFSELYYAYSLDTGVTWSTNVPLSPPFNHGLGYPDQNKLGDYYHMVSDNLGASVAYAATFNGEQDVYYLRIGEPDCNGNGIPDSQDITGGAEDCNQNMIPDECDPDCNRNALVDECEVRDGLAVDCDDNLVPDECDPDFDGDGLINRCDNDMDDDGVPNDDDPCPFTPLGMKVTANGVSFGDVDQNCVIELFDFGGVNVGFFPCINQSGPGWYARPRCFPFYDYDGDTDIDLKDFAQFQWGFGRR